jgi:hypothetical protein
MTSWIVRCDNKMHNMINNSALCYSIIFTQKQSKKKQYTSPSAIKIIVFLFSMCKMVDSCRGRATSASLFFISKPDHFNWHSRFGREKSAKKCFTLGKVHHLQDPKNVFNSAFLNSSDVWRDLALTSSGSLSYLICEYSQFTNSPSLICIELYNISTFRHV